MSFDRRPDESELQRELRDVICLAVAGDHVRWVLTDDDELGEWLAQATVNEEASRGRMGCGPHTAAVPGQQDSRRVKPEKEPQGMTRRVVWHTDSEPTTV